MPPSRSQAGATLAPAASSSSSSSSATPTCSTPGFTHEELRTLTDDELPPEQLPSSGQFQTDDEWLYIWFLLQNLPAYSTQRMVFRRRNNSVAFDTGARKLGNIEFSHQSWWRQRWIVNGKKLATMPYEVMTKRDADLNRAPVAINRVKFRNKPKAHRVPLCEIKYPLVTDEPDYDVVSYRYVWKVDGRVVRDVTIAAHSDALATDLFAKGDRLECTVTPTDGDLQAPQQVGPLQGEVSERAQGNASWSEILGSDPATK